MLYRLITKTYSRKADVLVLRRILDGVYPYRFEKKGRRWFFSALVLDADYETLLRCL